MKPTVAAVDSSGTFFRIGGVLLTLLLLLAASCTPGKKNEPFDPQSYLEDIPTEVEGLKVIAGPRSKTNIIHDMAFNVCNAHILFERMKKQNRIQSGGSAVFRVVVEYTGEVPKAVVEETTLKSKSFLQEVCDFIMDTDFTPWARNDTDTEFLYPMHFGT